jgi:hypothetical protein
MSRHLEDRELVDIRPGGSDGDEGGFIVAGGVNPLTFGAGVSLFIDDGRTVYRVGLEPAAAIALAEALLEAGHEIAGVGSFVEHLRDDQLVPEATLRSILEAFRSRDGSERLRVFRGDL